jgi:hypothetical protein
LAAASVFNRKRELAGQSLQTGFGSCDKVASKFDLAGVVAIAGSETSSDYAGRNDHSAFLVMEYFVLKLRALFVALQRNRHSRSVSIEISLRPGDEVATSTINVGLRGTADHICSH